MSECDGCKRRTEGEECVMMTPMRVCGFDSDGNRVNRVEKFCCKKLNVGKGARLLAQIERLTSVSDEAKRGVVRGNRK